MFQLQLQDTPTMLCATIYVEVSANVPVPAWDAKTHKFLTPSSANYTAHMNLFTAKNIVRNVESNWDAYDKYWSRQTQLNEARPTTATAPAPGLDLLVSASASATKARADPKATRSSSRKRPPPKQLYEEFLVSPVQRKRVTKKAGPSQKSGDNKTP